MRKFYYRIKIDWFDENKDKIVTFRSEKITNFYMAMKMSETFKMKDTLVWLSMYKEDLDGCEKFINTELLSLN